MIEPVHVLELANWASTLAPEAREIAVEALEHGKLLLLPRLPFRPEDDERTLLAPETADGRAKNVSFNPATGTIKGSSLAGVARERLAGMLSRFSTSARGLVENLVPGYQRSLAWGMTSFRPIAVAQRNASPRKDDTRLHVDAFESRPTQGQRILRVFCNVNPRAEPRVWHVGEPFEAYAERFLPRIGAQFPGSARLRLMLHLTKSLRTPYDHLMLGLHDRAKLDAGYQAGAPHTRIALPAGSTWVVYTDAVPHAALAGQYVLEQTFYLPVDAMREPDESPLRILERMTGRPLT